MEQRRHTPRGVDLQTSRGNRSSRWVVVALVISAVTLGGVYYGISRVAEEGGSEEFSSNTRWLEQPTRAILQGTLYQNATAGKLRLVETYFDTLVLWRAELKQNDSTYTGLFRGNYKIGPKKDTLYLGRTRSAIAPAQRADLDSLKEEVNWPVIIQLN